MAYPTVMADPFPPRVKPSPAAATPLYPHSPAAAIVAYLPQHRTYVETCCGGASIFWAKPRKMSKCEVLNDIDGDLINFYQVLHKDGWRLADALDSMPYSRRLFAQMRSARPRSMFSRALRFWYLNRTGFGGNRHNPTFGVVASRRAYTFPRTIAKSLDRLIERLRGVIFENLDVEQTIRLYDSADTLFHVDPPYVGSTQGYSRDFSSEDDVRLAKALKSVRGTWLLSHCDCQNVRRLYQRCHMRGFPRRYLIGCNSKSRGSEETRELLLSNWMLKKREGNFAERWSA